MLHRRVADLDLDREKDLGVDMVKGLKIIVVAWFVTWTMYEQGGPYVGTSTVQGMETVPKQQRFDDYWAAKHFADHLRDGRALFNNVDLYESENGFGVKTSSCCPKALR